MYSLVRAKVLFLLLLLFRVLIYRHILIMTVWCTSVCVCVCAVYSKDIKRDRNSERVVEGIGTERPFASNRPYTHARMVAVELREIRFIVYVGLYVCIYVYTYYVYVVFLDRLNGRQKRHDKMPATTSIRYSMRLRRVLEYGRK